MVKIPRASKITQAGILLEINFGIAIDYDNMILINSSFKNNFRKQVLKEYLETLSKENIIKTILNNYNPSAF